MKLDFLLAEYLYTHRRLDLPGIGIFMLNLPSFEQEEEIKQGKPVSEQGISFESNSTIKDNPELINFIAKETGKIRALAAANLDSYLGLALEFLNIGKPFLFEGIGSLVKIKSGKYAFASGADMPERIKEYSAREISATSTSEESFTGYKNILYSRREKTNWRRPTVVLLIIAGIALAVWGGYTVYKMTAGKNKSNLIPVNQKQIIAPQTGATSNKTDSAVAQTQNVPAGTYKFILEIANAKRAFERYGKLKSFQWNVQMETTDSVTYKLFMILPALAIDTSRIIDSLAVVNGRKVYIEY